MRHRAESDSPKREEPSSLSSEENIKSRFSEPVLGKHASLWLQSWKIKNSVYGQLNPRLTKNVYFLSSQSKGKSSGVSTDVHTQHSAF